MKRNWHDGEVQRRALLSAARALLRTARYMEGSPAWNGLVRPTAKILADIEIAERQAENVQLALRGPLTERQKGRLRAAYKRRSKLYKGGDAYGL